MLQPRQRLIDFDDMVTENRQSGQQQQRRQAHDNKTPVAVLTHKKPP
ncbi:MAG: hypothetical protein H0U59_07065 [Gemmatimonadaceae bacterium]|nr:hypothetical protein [Gemmatimonadaceae bacterium]